MRARVGAVVLVFAACMVTSVKAADRWLPAWRETTPMTTPRAGAAVVAAGGWVYVLGGVDGVDFLDSVEYAPLLPDGGLGHWRPGPPLREARGFFAAVAADGWLYAIGGGNGPHGHHLLASVERAAILDDGELGPWQTVESGLGRPRRCVKVVHAGQRLYALGGFNGHLLDSLEVTTLLGDGRLAAWQESAQRMTMPRYIHAAKAVGGRIYVIGGHDPHEGTGLSSVESAALEGGRLQAWQAEPALGQRRYALAAAAGRGLLYALGGLDGAIYSDAVEFARPGEGGLTTGWRATTPLSSPRANLTAFTAGDRLYVLGGTNRDGYYRSVEYAEIGADGRLGIVATAAEQARFEAARREARRPHRNTAGLPNAGRVREFVQTAAYSYIAVERDDGSRIWLAAPRMDVAVDDWLRFSRGLEMEHFHSRALDRDFDAILFVERVVRVDEGGRRRSANTEQEEP